MVDTGATDCFISATAADRCKLQRKHIAPMKVALADGYTKTPASAAFGRLAATTSRGTYSETLEFRVLDIGVRVDVVLGGSWLRQLSPVSLDYSGWGSLSFVHKGKPVTITGGSPGRPVSAKDKGALHLTEEVFLEPGQARKELVRYKRRFGNQPDPGHDVLVAAVAPKTAGEQVPPAQRHYKMSQVELDQLRARLDELLEKGYIRPSSSPYAAPCLMVPKPNNPKELRLVIDFRRLNSLTVRNRFPLPDIQQMFDDMQGATVFSSADVRHGFWQMPMAEQDIEKTAFVSHYGSYEWLVLPMGLTNSPSTYQSMMTQAFRHLTFVRVFIDDDCHNYAFQAP
ncbi:hypothetical protein CYMTET_4558 [Cymbomonas tetramitiformis]|uniref:Reverse transcriptase domain-containing protein n=1 Tax=Cymbomonas tetramitiformis TaxID=36881 RepID=A0AAE0H0Y9_9CHLO|nr:hypothetical protein CYMTET_4558 [Cymbomonas tetramitiformis]